ncbi:MAG TPA: DUF3037 domain-containing protein [Terriglobia bacterium]|nr:DUF3037 domain-containing protein [Terriglobia bacterium]
MADGSPLKKCSIFLVRYVPDLVRNESVNIGLLLHSRQEQYLGCLFTDDWRRVKRFHPRADLELLRELQPEFEKQIEEHESDLENYLQGIQSSFSNLIQLAEPRTCLLAEPQNEIQSLFARYVGARAAGPLPGDTRLRVKQRLTAALSEAGVWERLEKRIPAAPWTHSGDPFTFDYGYKPLRVEGKPNGHVSFIHALSLKRDAELAKVLVYSLERVRRKEGAQLTAVVEAPAAAGDKVAGLSQRILTEGDIKLWPVARAAELAQIVRHELMM